MAECAQKGCITLHGALFVFLQIKEAAFYDYYTTTKVGVWQGYGRGMDPHCCYFVQDKHNRCGRACRTTALLLEAEGNSVAKKTGSQPCRQTPVFVRRYQSTQLATEVSAELFGRAPSSALRKRKSLNPQLPE